MSDIDDLLDPLRFVNLKSFDLENLNKMGEGVFPEKGTLEHLAILDLVVKGFQSVHQPAFGTMIPNGQVDVQVDIGTTDTAVSIVQAGDNEIIEIDSLFIYDGTSSDTGNTYLAILENGVRIMVPQFVSEGEKISVSTETFEYLERV